MKYVIIPKVRASSGLSNLYFVLWIGGKKVWIPTKVKCAANAWDQDRQTITAKQPRNSDLNKILVKRKSELNDILNQFEYSKSELTPASLRKELDKTSGKSNPVAAAETKVKYLTDYFDLFTSKNKNTLSHNYLRKFKQVKDHLNEHRPNWELKDLTLLNLNDYLSYLIEDAELENATIVKHITIIRAAIKMAEIMGEHVPKDYLFLKRPKIVSRPFWLNDKSLNALLKVKPKPAWQIYKEEFLFRLYTGLRHSDSFNLKKENIIKFKNDYYIDFTTVKTKLDQNLLLSTKAVEILKKWNFNPPRLVQQKCNEYIKEIAKKALLNNLVERVRYSGSERIVNVYPEWKMISTHTSRRTFGRIWMDKGGSLSKLSRYYGHSSEKQTSEYIGYTAKEVNDELRRLMG